jgi:hypothetical protein
MSPGPESRRFWAGVDVTPRDPTSPAPPGPRAAPWLYRRIALFPLWFFESYLALTVFLFAFGPWPWPVPDPFRLYLFLFLAQAALWLGYRTGIERLPRVYRGRWSAERLIEISLLLNLLWLIPNYMLRMGVTRFDLPKIIRSITIGFRDPVIPYRAKFEGAGETTALNILGLLLYPLLWLLVPLAITHWKRLKPIYRWSFIFFVAADLLSWVAIGTNKGIADYALLLPCLVLAARPDILARGQGRRRAGVLALFALGLVLMLAYFGATMKSRGGGSIRTSDPNAKIELNQKDWTVRFLPPAARASVGAVAAYIDQGYYALGLALMEPFDWSYGAGNSYYLTGLVEHFTGKGSVSNRTYPAKLEKTGWDRYGRWHSIYSWIASDVTFPGALIFVFFIGRLFALVWLDVLGKRNPWAPPLWALLVIMLFYFSANNQVLAFANTANPFWALLLVWAWARKRPAVSDDAAGGTP